MIGNVPPELDQQLGLGVPFSVLDVGCGTGSWALEIALAYPNTQVTAIDLVTCPLPTYPNNLTFEIRDIVKNLPYPDNSFDVVHVCDIKLGIHDYRSLIGECSRVLKPEGWLLGLELDCDPTLMLDNAEDVPRYLKSVSEFIKIFHTALSERGLNAYVARELGDYARQVTALDHVKHVRVVVPWNDWSDDPKLKLAGRHSRLAFEEFSSSIRILLQDHGVLNPDRLGNEAKAEMDQEGIRPIWGFYHLVARKRAM
ncbi:S-adenosyl-L-methionine-dependent methyltransferase [Naematelia encephala]|uniref:S-adenosyl-L-methionine-dependent methyltransferase n=1 Tax=Naematelia encephala TaxID=71784 RepID=A0A1Y2AVS2_9TREE|nr:S-adenosyl-L-methionine-dependent methyltransferase [Naematelia encephala]